MRAEPKELQVYKHFKGNLYQIVTVAVHTETGEKLVVYRSLYKDDKIYARPLAMFLSEVDHKKYPNVAQKFRFELMGGEEEIVETSFNASDSVQTEENSETKVNTQTDDSVQTEENSEIEGNTQIDDDVQTEANNETEDTEQIEENAGLDPLLERFLDANSFEAKLDVFYLMKKKATKSMLSYVAMSLDIELSKEDIDEQYLEILNCLKTMEKYECNRLRP